MNITADITKVEELFPPRPGGKVDTALKQQQVAQEQIDSVLNVVTEHEHVDYQAIRVLPETPDIGTARTVTLSSANPVLMVLPNDAKRRSAVIIAVDNDIYLTNDQNVASNVQGAATNGQAFYLPKGIYVPVDNSGELYAACTTTSSSSRVSVLVNKDS